MVERWLIPPYIDLIQAVVDIHTVDWPSQETIGEIVALVSAAVHCALGFELNADINFQTSGKPRKLLQRHPSRQ